jgi:hypothetical protein
MPWQEASIMRQQFSFWPEARADREIDGALRSPIIYDFGAEPKT